MRKQLTNRLFFFYFSGLLSRYAKCKDSIEVVAVQNEYLAQLEADERSKEASKTEELDDSDNDDLLIRNNNRDTAFTAFDDSSEEEDSEEYESEEDGEEEHSENDSAVEEVRDKLGNTNIR